MNDKVKAVPSFQGKNRERDADDFCTVKRYGYDAEFSITATAHGDKEQLGIEVKMSETCMPYRETTIFIPMAEEFPIQVSETKLAREAIQITHN